MINFPDALPMDAILLVINKIKGKADPSSRDFSEALWNIVGYAASQTLPQNNPIRPIMEEVQDINMDDFAAILEQAVSMNDTLGEARRLPWASIMKIGLKLLISLFL